MKSGMDGEDGTPFSPHLANFSAPKLMSVPPLGPFAHVGSPWPTCGSVFTWPCLLPILPIFLQQSIPVISI